MMTHLIRMFAALALVLAAALPAAAQSPLTVIAKVNDRVITAFEVDQRARFMTLLRAASDPRKEALERLIEERLQFDIGEKFGIVPTDEAVLAGMEEFAQRGQLSREDFIQALAGAGVEEQTFRDFVKAGLIWREVVRGRFGPLVRITDADIDKALSATAPQRQGVRIQFAEIIMPADTPARRDQALGIAQRIALSPSPGAFSAAARQYSLSGSRDRGGLVDWVDLADMQPGLANILLKLQPGEVSDPVELPNAVAVFQLRAIQETGTIDPIDQTVKYLVYTIPDGAGAAAQAELTELREDTDFCPDLYEHVSDLPAERLQEGEFQLGNVPGDIALALARLDKGEIAADMTPAGNLRVVMLCSRERILPEEITRDSVRTSLINQRLGQLGAGYLAELRGNANIVLYGQ